MINIFNLPFVRLENRDSLPEESGYYFVVQNENVLYIGKSKWCRGLWGRWHKNYHHRYNELSVLENVYIYYWIEIPLLANFQKVEELEKALIWYFKPKLNKVYSNKWELIYIKLNKLPTLWTPSYFVSTAGNICTESVKRYIEQQKA